MGRPKGSKNKTCLSQKEKALQDVLAVERQEKKERKKKTRSTTSSPSVEETSSSGEGGANPVGKRVIKGYVNIQKGGKFFYTGGDIHATEELAKKMANKNTVDTIFIAFEV